jgi:transcriptional regulator with XRE-family HTH domain
MPSGLDTTVLDGPFIRQRALKLRLSSRKLSERCGISAPTLQRIIQGKNHPDMMLSHVLRLAQELDTTFPHLIAMPQPSPMTSDAVRLEAALLAARRRLNLAELQTALGWHKARALAALDALSCALAGTGAQLNRSYSVYTIGPRDGVLEPSRKDAVKTVRDGRTELGLGEAKMLRRIMQGRLTSDRMERNIGGDARARLGTLLEHGLIEPNGAGFVLTPAVEFSLGIRARPLKRRASTRGEGRTR